MNLRWLLGNFTDPQYRIPLREQFRLSNVANEKHLDRGAFLTRTLAILAPVILAFVLLKPALQSMGFSGSRPMLLGIVIIVVATWPWSAWMYRSLYVKSIRRAMRDAGYDLCLECGYDLRGLDRPPHPQPLSPGERGAVPRCPECGAEPEPLDRREATP
jgi:hypothetical protein